MTYGLLTEGLKLPTAEELTELFQNDFKTAFGNDIDLSVNSFAGVMIGIFVERFTQLYEILNAVYYSPFPDFADNISLDNASSITGISRILGKPSKILQVQLTTTGLTPVTIPAATQLKQSSTGTIWQTLQDVIIPANSSIITQVESLEDGVFTCPIGSLNTIVNPINGFDSVTNLTASVDGRLTETDSELRRRREINLVTAKGGTVKAVTNALLNVDGVTFASGTENRTAIISGGLAPHSYSFTVEGGLDQDIADTIREVGGDGIETNGSVSITTLDSEGNAEIIRFNRAFIVDLYLIVNITSDSNYPVDGDNLVKQILTEFGNNYKNGDDVLNWRLIGALDSIAGIVDIEILQSLSPTPTSSNNISISNTQRVRILTSNIAVNS